MRESDSQREMRLFTNFVPPTPNSKHSFVKSFYVLKRGEEEEDDAHFNRYANFFFLVRNINGKTMMKEDRIFPKKDLLLQSLVGRHFCSLWSPCISITESIDVPQGSQARRAITKYENYLVRRKKKISMLKNFEPFKGKNVYLLSKFFSKIRQIDS